MLGAEEAFRLAVGNVAKWGDTDVFPFAPENHVFHDRATEIVRFLTDTLDRDLPTSLLRYPVDVQRSLSLITYEGFRQVSQIDPVWNAYFLGLVLRMAPEIELARIPLDRKAVFSYRINIDQANFSLFEPAAWNQFSDASQEIARSYEYVAICDIADFYGRVYHHRIENSLMLLPNSGDLPKKINKLLQNFSGGPSYGLPVGGPAARILSELLLNRVDRLLGDHGVRFCRYADDYRLFAKSREEAFRALVLLTELLALHEGLTLQRHKTRVLATKDFLRSPLLLPEDSDELSMQEKQERRLLKLSLRYDPYSNTADQDYEKLKGDVEQFDVLGMLTAEVAKSRVNVPVIKKLAQIIRLFEPEVRDAAADMLVTNLQVLAPALPVVLRVLEEIIPHVSPPLQARIPAEIRRRIKEEAYWIMVPVNLAYALRVLQHDNSEENIPLCTALFDSAPGFIQRDIVYLMYRWHNEGWLSDKRRRWGNLHPWVKRALLLTSYALADEGEHWRRSVRTQVSGLDSIANTWMHERMQAGRRELAL